MAPFTGHCRGCNQDFPNSISDRCPQCGEDMTVAADSPTLDLDETMPGKMAPVRPTHAPDLAARLLGCDLANYSINRFLGRGGMAWVFQARHHMLHRPCALKFLNPELEKQAPKAVEVFQREARAAASLVHPHVVAVHNIGDAEGLHFIEMELVPGQSLQHLLVSEKSLSVIDATGFMVQCCSALAAAHQQGLIHRDFKPSNILVRDDGVAKLADFGLAKRVAHAPPPKPGRRDDRGLAGTPYYMAPELFRGTHGSRASDVYAVGVSFFYLLTGHFPFQHANIARLAALHEEQPIPDPRTMVPAVPAQAVELIHRACAKDAHQRFQDGTELYQELQRLFTQLRSMASIVAEAIEGTNAELHDDGERLRIVISLNNNRSQTVYVEETRSEAWATQIVRVFSICGPALPSYYQRALELNAQVPHGSLAIETVDGSPHFVMLNSYLRSTCDPMEIRHSILEIAQWADDVEQALTDDDRF